MTERGRGVHSVDWSPLTISGSPHTVVLEGSTKKTVGELFLIRFLLHTRCPKELREERQPEKRLLVFGGDVHTGNRQLGTHRRSRVIELLDALEVGDVLKLEGVGHIHLLPDVLVHHVDVRLINPADGVFFILRSGGSSGVCLLSTSVLKSRPTRRYRELAW